MTRVHALVATFWFDLQAAFTATIFHKIFQTVKAFSRWMTYFFALVTTLEFNIADLTTVWSAFVAEDISHELFTAIA